MKRSSFFGSIVKKPQDHRSRIRRRGLHIDRLESRLLLAGDALADLNDEFDDAGTLNQWQRVEQAEHWNADPLQVWNIDQTQPGRMVMQPHTSVWYQNWRGPLVFKEVRGDFLFTSEVVITDRDDVGGHDADDIPGDAQFSLGGLMVRTPRAINNPATDWQPGSMQDDGTNNGENYVFLSIGHATDGQFSLEVKTTRNSNSQLQLTPLGATANTATLRIARIGDSIITLYRLPGEDWTVHRRYSRPDMPDTLQLGMVTYTDWTKASDFDPFFHNSHVLQQGVSDPTPFEPFNPDLVAGFEYARFARPQVPTELEGLDLVNTATNQQLLSFLGDAPSPVPDPDPVPDPASHAMHVGVNLEQNVDWSSAWVFKDAFNRSRPWGARAFNPLTGATMWQFQAGQGPELQVDERGWVTELLAWTAADGTAYQQRATTVVFTGDARQPAGIYRAEWDGTGELAMPFVTERGTTPDGRHYALVDMPAGVHFAMDLLSTDPADPVRNIDLWMPDFHGQSLIQRDWHPGDASSPFHPLFVERLRDFDTLRFMDWQRTNYSDVVTWDERSLPNDASQADSESPGYYDYRNNGVAPEYLVALANEVDANPWFNMPHRADDDYVRNFATLVRDTLEPERRVYVEWSNELWNGFFPVNGWLVQQTQLPENAGRDFFAVAAREIRRDFDIWSEVFAGQEDRLVRVVAGQQANSWVVEQLLANMDGRFDAISSTAYAGLWDGLPTDASTTPDDLIDSLLDVSLPWSRDRLIEHRAVVDRYERQLGREIDFVTYESGSHIFGFGTPLMNSPARDAAVEAMYSPRMYDVYQALLQDTRAAGVDLYNEFTFTSHYGASPFGTYGLLYAMDQPLAEAPQLRSLLDFIDASQPDDEPLAAVRLKVVDASGNPLDTLTVGQSFTLQAIVEDLRSDGAGVFSAYVDVTYDASRAESAGTLTFGEQYGNARSGNTDVPGLIDEAGAFASMATLGGEPVVLFSLPMIATASGTLAFCGHLADLLPYHEMTLFNLDSSVPADRIEFICTTIAVSAAATATDDQFTIFNDRRTIALDVLANDAADAATVGTLTIVSLSPTPGGAVTINAEGDRILFRPAAGFFGETSFDYTVRDGNGHDATATVSVQVNKRWHNGSVSTDVNGDTFSSPLDALLVINILNSLGSIALPAVPPAALADLPFLDVNGDDLVSPVDALLVINELNAFASGRDSAAGEGEFVPTLPLDLSAAPHMTAGSVSTLEFEAPVISDIAFAAAKPTPEPLSANSPAVRLDRVLGGGDIDRLFESEDLETLLDVLAAEATL